MKQNSPELRCPNVVAAVHGRVSRSDDRHDVCFVARVHMRIPHCCIGGAIAWPILYQIEDAAAKRVM